MTDATEETSGRTPTNVDRREPANVHEAIRCVMLDLGGVPKMTGAQHKARQGTNSAEDKEGVPYAYRSVDQITGDGQRLFATYGCIWTPKVLEQSEREFVMGKFDTRWVDVTFKVLYWLVGPGGAEVVVPTTKRFREDGSYTEEPDPEAWYMTGDVHLVGPLYSVGRDNSDKGQNKALTQALKQALLQTLSIGDPMQDGDHEKHEQTASGPRVVSDAMAQEFKGKVGRLPKDHQRVLVDSLKAEGLPVPELMSTEQYGKANAMLQLHVILAHQGQAPPSGSAVTDSVVNTTGPGLASDAEYTEAVEFLREQIDAVPEVDDQGVSQRLTLRSNLRGLFGDPDAMSYEQVLEATTIASHWPDPVPEVAAEAPSAPQEPSLQPPAPDDAPQTPLQLVRKMVGPDPSDGLIDTAMAEVQLMKGPEVKDHLSQMGAKTSGTVSELKYRLVAALVTQRHGAEG